MWSWQKEYRFMRLMGYNTKRALMMWALSLLSPKIQDVPEACESMPDAGVSVSR